MCEYKVTIQELPNYTKKWILDSNPHTYQGFIDPETGLYEGEGRIKFLNTSNPIQTYIGTFRSGEMTGFGSIFYSDGIIYKGQVINSQREGFGTIYNPDGKFQYDGMWVKDQIDKPIYVATIGSNGLLVSQGFQVHGEYNGWFITHTNGYISSITYYQDKKCIKGFGSHISKFGSDSVQCKYIVNDLFSQTNTDVKNFLFVELPKISKSGNLQEFLSQESNLKMLDSLSFEYDPITNMRKENTGYKTFGYNGLEQIGYFDTKADVQIKVSIYDETTVFVGETSAFVDIERQSKINGSLWLVKLDKRNSIKLEFGPNGFVGLKEFECISKGEYTKLNNIWILNGQGWMVQGSKCYTGFFVINKISQGIEQNKSDQRKIYEGSFNPSGKYDGIGTEWFNYNTRIKYQGEFSNGKYHGNGSSYYPNSDSESIEYVGNWVNGYKHGQGTLFSVSGDEIYTGNFNNDQIA